jgi:hypothetical protein
VIGNDIIDLALAQKESNWKRKGFLDKIFTKKEQWLIFNSENPEIMVWNLWSRKEAAYKIYNRQTQIMAYIPLQLECFNLHIDDDYIYGKVLCYGTIYFTKTVIALDYIETIAVLNTTDFDNVRAFESAEKIVQINGIPNFHDSDNQIFKPASKSHHGRFEKMVWLHS